MNQVSSSDITIGNLASLPLAKHYHIANQSRKNLKSKNPFRVWLDGGFKEEDRGGITFLL